MTGAPAWCALTIRATCRHWHSGNDGLLVYGDPRFEAPLNSLHRQLCAHACQALEHPNDLDRLRALLIACGQVEQGAHDALERARQPDESEPLARLFHQATAHAAEAFYSLAHKEQGLLPPPRVDAPAALRGLRQCLDRIDNLPDLVAAVKLPEGFNLHAMYPEQYVVAAGRWLTDHSDQHGRAAAPGAVVVGIRSIGTTLAAAVATVLRAGGWQVQSFTVRPQGHPYARTVELENMQFAPATLGVVVDEGPGISGSSMAATAAALVKAGLAPEGIAFLPGHAHNPGGAGAPEVQRWWQMAPRYVADGETLTFGGRGLPQALATAIGMQPVQIDNVSGGVWRQHVYPRPEDWPAICNQFERVKYLCTAADGSKVLFKFYGLAASSPSLTSAAEATAALLQARAANDLAPAVRGVAYGFVATEWLEGTPLRDEAPPPDMAGRLGAYIARVAGPTLTAGELVGGKCTPHRNDLCQYTGGVRRTGGRQGAPVTPTGGLCGGSLWRRPYAAL